MLITLASQQSDTYSLSPHSRVNTFGLTDGSNSEAESRDSVQTDVFRHKLDDSVAGLHVTSV